MPTLLFYLSDKQNLCRRLSSIRDCNLYYKFLSKIIRHPRENLSWPRKNIKLHKEIPRARCGRACL
jgi:hypothetical protein